MDIDRDEIIRLTEEYGGQWGINHTRRLLHLISLIGADQRYNTDATWVAAYLHDWGGYSPWRQEGVHHAARSKEVAADFLVERAYPGDFAALVLECIEFHHDPDPGRSIEAILLCDADMLDFLGVVGVLRDFSKNPRDLRKGFETVQRRRAALPDSLILEKSKEIAVQRVSQMDELLATFEADTFGCF
ncbi:MAG: HD domain-containing protein [Anaerolineae bacterium]|jgi:uncharacterized protein|nr:HD domain-containing protein [Anaerolineae bacterium]